MALTDKQVIKLFKQAKGRKSLRMLKAECDNRGWPISIKALWKADNGELPGRYAPYQTLLNIIHEAGLC